MHHYFPSLQPGPCCPAHRLHFAIHGSGPIPPGKDPFAARGLRSAACGILRRRMAFYLARSRYTGSCSAFSVLRSCSPRELAGSRVSRCIGRAASAKSDTRQLLESFAVVYYRGCLRGGLDRARRSTDPARRQRLCAATR